jgi:hypothetical protein
MAKSNWEKANIIVIFIGIITLLRIGANTYHMSRGLMFSPYGQGIVALSMVVFHFGIFFGFYCLIRWIAKSYFAKNPIGSKHVSEVKGDKCRICDKKIAESEKAYIEDGELLCIECEQKRKLESE